MLTALLLGFSTVAPALDTVEITVITDKPGAQISRHIYGQFAEHLGRGIYEGIWVGKDSPIANERGFRTDVIDALKKLRIPNIRWPGGCFADEYHWRDGIGPAEQRPVKVNNHWGGVAETNEFGTHEFFELVEMLGAEAYIAGNLGSGSPREMMDWLEYMTADNESSLAKLRRQNGREEPWKVAFWGVGNESWGCGGNMRPEYYADLYRQFATFLKSPDGNRPKKVASGGYNDLTDWTDVLSQIPSNIDGISYHYYTLPTNNWDEKGRSTGFSENEWISHLANTLKIEGHIKNNIAILEKNDPEGRIGLYVDEWGSWYDAEPGRNPGFLYQQNTIRDAVLAAVNLNIFHRYSERIHMANIAQMVNVLQAMILTEEDKMVLTPTYHVFEMFTPFQDSTFIPVEIDTPPQIVSGEISIPAISISAAKGTDGKVHISMVNLDPHTKLEVKAHITGFKFNEASGRALSGEQMDSHNSFTAPNVVSPIAISARKEENNIHVVLPAKSVVVMTLD
jgi:alpha-N-arabinofuranosidase